MDSMTFIQLRKLAAERGVRGRSKMKKADLIASLRRDDHDIEGLLDSLTIEDKPDAFEFLPQPMRAQVLGFVSPKSLARAKSVSSSMKGNIDDRHFMHEIAPEGLQPASKQRDVVEIMQTIAANSLTYPSIGKFKYAVSSSSINVQISSKVEVNDNLLHKDDKKAVYTKLLDSARSLSDKSIAAAYQVRATVDVGAGVELYRLSRRYELISIEVTYDYSPANAFKHPALKHIANAFQPTSRNIIKRSTRLKTNWNIGSGYMAKLEFLNSAETRKVSKHINVAGFDRAETDKLIQTFRVLNINVIFDID